MFRQPRTVRATCIRVRRQGLLNQFEVADISSKISTEYDRRQGNFLSAISQRGSYKGNIRRL